MIDINKTSEELLLAIKMQQPTSQFQLQLQQLKMTMLKEALKNDELKKAFWINIYNSFYQILAAVHKLPKKEIYQAKKIDIAGVLFSLDDVEHGILRRYRYKYSLGLFPKLFVRKIIKKLAVDKIDYRIHFALNCGAKSCPPIAFYNHDRINDQLNLATQSFLEGESIFEDDTKTVHTTALFKWFKFDFGGEKGVREIYKKQLGKDISDYSIVYKEYSWEEDLANFA